MDTLLRNLDTALAVSMLVAVAASGCTASRYRVAPGDVGVQVEAPRVRCGERHRDIPVKVRVHNDSAGILKIVVDDRPGPPYKLSWLSYVVLDEAGNVDWEYGAGGHGPLPQPTLTMETGDRTVLLATLYDIGEADYGRSFRIRFEDEEKRSWTTDAFRPCRFASVRAPAPSSSNPATHRDATTTAGR